MRKLLFILLFLPIRLFADNYYVASWGLDVTNDGSYATPWSSMSYAVSSVSSGDVVYLLSNITDNSCVDLPTGVSLDLGGYTITTSYVAASAYYGAIRAYSSSLANGNQFIRNGKLVTTFVATPSTGGRGITVWHRYNVDISNFEVRNFPASGILIEHESDWLTYPSNYASGNSVINCMIVDCGDRHWQNEGGLRITGQVGFRVSGTSFNNSNRTPCYNGNTMNISHCINPRIYNCTFIKPDHNGNCGYAWDWNMFVEIFQSRGVEWDHNTHTGAATVDLGCPPYAGYSTTKDTCRFSLSVHDNTFDTSTGEQLANRTVDRNQVAINFEASLEYCYAYNNVIKHYPTGIEIVTAPLAFSYTQNYVYIYNNVLQDIGWTVYPYAYGIVVLSEGVTAGTESRDNFHIWNNSIYGGGGNNYMGIEWTQCGNCTNSDIHNNIVRGFSNSGIALQEQATKDGTFTGFDVTYNDLYENGYSNDVYVQSGVTRTGGDITSENLKVDPLWLTLSDFRLQETSPVIGQGVNVGLTTDIIGHAWQTIPAMGAYEFGTPIIPPIIEDYPSGLLKPSPTSKQFFILNNRLLKLQ